MALVLALVVLRRFSRALQASQRRTATLQAELQESAREARSRTQALRAVEGRLVKESSKDALTEIPNRVYFDLHYPREWKRAARMRHSLALLFVAVDHFDAVNEKHGRAVGDACLKAVAGALERFTKRAEDFVARHDGVRFVVVAPHADAEGATRLAERIHGRVAALDLMHEGRFVPLTVSIGVAAAVPVSATAGDLVAVCLRALDQAKAEGRDRTVVAPPLAQS